MLKHVCQLPFSHDQPTILSRCSEYQHGFLLDYRLSFHAVQSIAYLASYPAKNDKFSAGEISRYSHTKTS